MLGVLFVVPTLSALRWRLFCGCRLGSARSSLLIGLVVLRGLELMGRLRHRCNFAFLPSEHA